MTPVQKLVGLAVLMASAAGFAWQVQDWRMGKKLAEQSGQHKDELAQVSGAATKQLSAEQAKRLALEKVLGTSDQQRTRKLTDAQRDQARLRDRLATADIRLSVLLAEDSASSCDMPAAANPSGVVHGAKRAQLDPAHAQGVIAITDAGDQGLIALRACQSYAKEVPQQNKILPG